MLKGTFGIPQIWNKFRIFKDFKLTENDKCVGGGWGVACSKCILKPDSGCFEAFFEIKNTKSKSMYIGVALAGKMKTAQIEKWDHRKQKVS